MAAVTPADPVWCGQHIVWKEPTTWRPILKGWLAARARPDGLQRMAALGEQDLCWDDSDWLDLLAEELTTSVEAVQAELANAFDGVTLRTYHSCRVPDAGVFYREGLKINDPEALAEQARRIVAGSDDLAWMRPSLEQMIAEFDDRNRDEGRLYLCADDRPQLDDIGHYLLYGSEWIQCLLGWGAHRALRQYGAPTMVEVDLPFRWATWATREAFARHLLQEWTRLTVNEPSWSPALDFSIVLHIDVPATCIVGHYHPWELKDPFHGKTRRLSSNVRCPACEHQPRHDLGLNPCNYCLISDNINSARNPLPRVRRVPKPRHERPATGPGARLRRI